MDEAIKIKINLKKFINKTKNESIIASTKNECRKNIEINLKINKL